LRLATGSRFCNRQEERALLKECLEQQRPIVLISPRRYGKSSLAHKTVEEIGFPFCAIDFMTAYDDNAICQSIVQGVSELVSAIMPANMKTLEILEKCFQGMKAVLRYKFIELEFTHSVEKTDPVRQVLETLRGLEALAVKLDKTVVIFMDEFQRVVETPKGDAIQGAVRNVAQSTKKIAFIFSGSSRHMLNKVFDEPNAPLYMICEKLQVKRIGSEHYDAYIQDAAKIKWKSKLDKNIIDRILTLTENHPFYVNYLCGKLWRQSEVPTTEEEVNVTWKDCLLNEERRLVLELDALTFNQRLLMKAIAKTPGLKEPTGAAFLAPLGLSSGTAVPALKTLLNKDLLFVDDEQVTRVLDPLLKYMLMEAF
jgi:AAA+ ATPase superfamily predicted ATPase